MTPEELDALEAATRCLKLPYRQDHTVLITRAREHLFAMYADTPGDIAVLAGIVAACNAVPGLVKRARELEAEVVRCHERLEIDHEWAVTTRGPRRVEVPTEERARFPDAVSCRDATIEGLRERVRGLEADAKLGALARGLMGAQWSRPNEEGEVPQGCDLNMSDLWDLWDELAEALREEGER